MVLLRNDSVKTHWNKTDVTFHCCKAEPVWVLPFLVVNFASIKYVYENPAEKADLRRSLE